MTTDEKIINVLNSPEAVDVRTIIAYVIKQSGNLTDDEISENAVAIANELSNSLGQIHYLNPTKKEVKQAVVRLLEIIVKATRSPFDDAALALLKKFV